MLFRGHVLIISPGGFTPDPYNPLILLVIIHFSSPHTLMMDVTMTHDLCGRNTQCNGIIVNCTQMTLNQSYFHRSP